MMDNTAVVQIIQFFILILFVFIAVACWSARFHLPHNKFDPLIDICMVGVLLVYAITFKIIFST